MGGIAIVLKSFAFHASETPPVDLYSSDAVKGTVEKYIGAAAWGEMCF